MSVHLQDYAEWVDQLEPATRDLLENAWPEAAVVAGIAAEPAEINFRNGGLYNQI